MNSPAAVPAAPRFGWLYRLLRYRVLVLSVALHVIAFAGAGAWIVSTIKQRPKPHFEARVSAITPPRIRQPTLDAGGLNVRLSNPVAMKRLTSPQPAKINLPEIPESSVTSLVTVPGAMGNPFGSVGGAGERGGGSGSGDGARRREYRLRHQVWVQYAQRAGHAGRYVLRL